MFVSNKYCNGCEEVSYSIKVGDTIKCYHCKHPLYKCITEITRQTLMSDTYKHIEAIPPVP